MHNRFWIGCEIGSVESCLSRFATTWGKDEEEKPPKKVKQCFKASYIRPLLKKKRDESFSPIQNVEPLKNGHLINKDAVSKSRVLGY